MFKKATNSKKNVLTRQMSMKSQNVSQFADHFTYIVRISVFILKEHYVIMPLRIAISTKFKILANLHKMNFVNFMYNLFLSAIKIFHKKQSTNS